MQKSIFVVGVLAASIEASKLTIAQEFNPFDGNGGGFPPNPNDDIEPNCCKFFSKEDFLGESFIVCMEEIEPFLGSTDEFNYWQASEPKTDDPTFDDSINSVKCGVPENGIPIARPSLCYDHLTVTRWEVTGESVSDYRITAECSWTGSEPWEDGDHELKSVNYPYISSVIVDYVPPPPPTFEQTTVYEEPNCQG